MTQFQTGYQAMREAIASQCNLTEALQALADAANTTAADLFAGGVTCLQAVAVAAREHGLPQFKSETLNEFLRMPPATMTATLMTALNSRAAESGDMLGALVATVEMHRAQIVFKAPSVEPAQPQEVRVVAMPARETLQTVYRDSDNEITGTRTLQTDVVPA